MLALRRSWSPHRSSRCTCLLAARPGSVRWSPFGTNSTKELGGVSAARDPVIVLTPTAMRLRTHGASLPVTIDVCGKPQDDLRTRQHDRRDPRAVSGARAQT